MQKILPSWIYHYRWQIIICLVFLIGIYFRFQNFPDKYAFDFDPSRDTLIAFYGSRNFQFPLIGASSGIGAFTFGPWYYWQLIIISILFPSLWVPWIYIGIFSLGFMLVMYMIGKELGGKTLGLILLTLASFSPSQVGPTAGLSNPNLIPLHAALTIYIAILFLKKKSSVLLAFLWGVIIGIGINNHFQMLLLLVVPPIIFAMKQDQRLKKICYFFLGLVITFSPLFLFNIFSNWYTITGFGSFIANTGSATYVPNSWTIYLTQFWPEFFSYVLGTPQWFSLLFLLIMVGVYVRLLVRQEITKELWVLGGCSLIIFIILRYYSGERQYYYLLFLHPLLFLFMGYALFFLSKLRWGITVCVGLLVSIIIFTTPMDLQRGNTREDNTKAKSIANMIAVDTSQKSVTLYNCRDNEKAQAQAVAFFLLTHNFELTDTGKKIGIVHSDCIDTRSLSSDKVYVDLSYSSVSQLESSGWDIVSPEDVYAETVNWWR